MPFDGDITLFAGLNTDNVTSSLENLKKTIKKGFTNIIRYGLGVRSIFALIRKLRTALISGFGNLAQVSEPFNTAVSDMMNALAGLKSSFASAFAPIIQTVAPILTFFINKIADAVDAVGMLIAALTGQKQYIKYIPAQQDFAESMDKTGKNANKTSKSLDKTNKSAKALERTLAGFDDVEILHEPKDDSSSSNTSPTSGGTSAKASASEVAGVVTASISDVFSNLAQLLKDAWAKADFTEVGKLVGTKISDALNNIDWVSIKDACERIGKSIATFINGFFVVPNLSHDIGNAISEIINSAFTFAYAFVSTLNWSSLGYNLKELIVATLTGIDWELIYDTATSLGSGVGQAFNQSIGDPATWIAILTTVANGWNTVVGGLDSFITTTNWLGFGQSIGKGLTVGIQKFNWLKLADLFSNSVNGIVDAGYGAITEFNWSDFGTYISVALHVALRKIDWEKIYTTVESFGSGIGTALQKAINNPFIWIDIGVTIAKGLSAAVRGVTAFVETIDFGKLGENLGNGLNAGIDAFDWNEVTVALKDVINGAILLAYMFVLTFDFGKFGKRIGLSLSNAIQNIEWEKFGASISIAINGLFEALDGFIIGMNWGELGESIIRFITGFFDNFSWETVGQTLHDLIHGLFEALTAVIVGINWEELPDNIVGAITDFFEGFKWEELAGDLEDFLMVVLDELGVDGSGLLESAASVGGRIIGALLGAILDGIFNPQEGEQLWSVQLGEDIEQKLNEMAEGEGGLFGWLSEFGKKLAKSFIDGIYEEIKDTPAYKIFADAFSEENVDEEWAKPQGAVIGNALMEGLNIGVQDVENADPWGWVDTFLTTVEDLFGIGSPSKVFEQYGKWLMEGLQNGVKGGQEDAVDQVSDVESGMQAIFSGIPKLLIWSALGSGLLMTGLIAGILLTKPTVITTVSNLELDMRKTISDKNLTWKTMGQDLLDNIKSGLNDKKTALVATINTIMLAAKAKVIEYEEQFKTVGTNLMNELTAGISDSEFEIVTMVSDIVGYMYGTFNDADFWSVGKNIAVGIYNGLADHGQWLQTLAWNTAVEMYNSACRALDIHSPSRKFEYIGDMVGAGLANGVENSQSAVTDAMSETINAMVDEAESNSPDIHVDASIDTFTGGLDDTLTTFSDKIVDSFSALVDTLQRLGNGVTYTIPPVAQGRVVPYGSTISTQNEDVIDRLAQQIGELQSNGISLEELRAMMVELFTQYMNIDFTIGDEQIARHANAGNARLNRRYNPVTG